MLTEKQIQDIKRNGLSVETVESQLSAIKNGLQPLNILRPATVNDGIIALNKELEEKYIRLWEEYESGDHKILKFVPASGAATRMFKGLYEYLDSGKETADIQQILENLDHFAFAKKLQGKTGREAIDYIINGLHYGDLPKALIPFHSYRDEARTPILEHLVEGANYARSRKKTEVNIHFTVKQSDTKLFQDYLAEHIPAYEARFGVKYHITTSIQSPATNTVAANPDGTPFEDENGNLIYRPGGHGALLHNLNAQDADVIFIKNIDNVVPDKLSSTVAHYKKVLGGVLLEAMQSDNYGEQPIRVCGVVKNTGEPGGGPFIVQDTDGKLSYQILEQVQVPDKNLLNKSTHFNPVDIVCSTKGKSGKKLELLDFTDPQSAIITKKSYKGKDLMAYELPGLWNGAMARWQTIFVEVPIETFNPVKTINDLLREEHQ